MCGNFPGTPPIDDPRNTRNPSYGTFELWAGMALDFPNFGRPDSELMPHSLDDPHLSDNLSMYPLMQDVVREFRERGPWRGNHSDGPVRNTNPDINPSAGWRGVPERDHIFGANILFYDMSVRWFLIGDLVHVGGGRYSVMPPALPEVERPGRTR